MLPGNYDQSADVRNLTTYAVVGGVRREIESLTLDREIANDLPDTIAGGSGIGGGTGRIVWATQDSQGFRLPTSHGVVTHAWVGSQYGSASVQRVDGSEVRRNHAPNPRITGEASWSHTGDTDPLFGGWDDGYGVELRAGRDDASRVRVFTLGLSGGPGEWTISFDVQQVAGVGRIAVYLFDTTTGEDTLRTLDPIVDRERVTITLTPSHTWDRLYLEFRNLSSVVEGQAVGRFDRVLVEEGVTEGSYFDGDSPTIPGQIEFPGGDSGVETVEPSPWAPVAAWPPDPGDLIKVYVTDGHTSWPRFTGRIDKTRGPVGGVMTSDVVDFRDKLNMPVTIAARLAQHVPIDDNRPYRWLGLDYWTILSDVLRRARVYITPIAGDDAMLSVQFQGSTYAHIGTTRDSEGPTTDSWPRFHIAPWGWGAGELYARYEPANTATTPTKSGTIQITLMVSPGHRGNSHVYVGYGGDIDNEHIRLRVWSDRRVTAFWDNIDVVTMSANQMRNATNVVLLVKGSTWTIRNDQGQSATGTQSRSGSGRVEDIRVYNDAGARVAGLIVDSPVPALEFRNQYFTPAATFTPSSLVLMMTMSPRLENRVVADIIDQICKATLTGAWFDETGVLRMVPSDRLRDAEPVQTVTSLDDITALDWETSLLSCRSRVHVNWRSATVSRTRRHRLELYRGSKSTMGEGDVVETFATPDNDTEWFGVDRNPIRLDDSNWGYYNRNLGSLTGVHYIDDDDNELSTSSNSTTIRVENLGTVGLKITHIAGAYGSNVEGNLATSETGSALRESKRGEALPVVRGRGEGKWADETTTSSLHGATLPDGTQAPELEHDLGPWGFSNSAERIADFLAERVTRVSPIIRGMTVTYDPRRQLGDVITAQLGVLDVTLRLLIVGISESHQSGEHTQSLNVRVIDATSTRDVTYQQLEDAWAGRDYAAFQSVWENLTYRDLQRNPLRGA